MLCTVVIDVLWQTTDWNVRMMLTLCGETSQESKSEICIQSAFFIEVFIVIV